MKLKTNKSKFLPMMTVLREEKVLSVTNMKYERHGRSPMKNAKKLSKIIIIKLLKIHCLVCYPLTLYGGATPSKAIMYVEVT